MNPACCIFTPGETANTPMKIVRAFVREHLPTQQLGDVEAQIAIETWTRGGRGGCRVKSRLNTFFVKGKAGDKAAKVASLRSWPLAKAPWQPDSCYEWLKFQNGVCSVTGHVYLGPELLPSGSLPDPEAGQWFDNLNRQWQLEQAIAQGEEVCPPGLHYWPKCDVVYSRLKRAALTSFHPVYWQEAQRLGLSFDNIYSHWRSEPALQDPRLHPDHPYHEYPPYLAVLDARSNDGLVCAAIAVLPPEERISDGTQPHLKISQLWKALRGWREAQTQEAIA
ncbi:MAG: hypothetical protein AAGF24_05305 [Cyanobacteria bacterium P01_H01_bin.121]